MHGLAIRRCPYQVGGRRAQIHWPRLHRGLAGVRLGLACLRRSQLQGACSCRGVSRHQARQRLPVGGGPWPDRAQVRVEVRGLGPGDPRGPDVCRLHAQDAARPARLGPRLPGWRALADQVHLCRPRRAVERQQRRGAGAAGRPDPRSKRRAGQRGSGARRVLEERAAAACDAPRPSDEPELPHLFRRRLRRRGLGPGAARPRAALLRQAELLRLAPPGGGLRPDVGRAHRLQALGHPRGSAAGVRVEGAAYSDQPPKLSRPRFHRPKHGLWPTPVPFRARWPIWVLDGRFGPRERPRGPGATVLPMSGRVGAQPQAGKITHHRLRLAGVPSYRPLCPNCSWISSERPGL
mmetsp:Transcript_7646/g.21785  ORF Transcript_7646/g.21785 Transcript_7646/m.21785 type:complete len:350 (+) Transcript_7646:274-1323(+)